MKELSNNDLEQVNGGKAVKQASLAQKCQDEAIALAQVQKKGIRTSGREERENVLANLIKSNYGTCMRGVADAAKNNNPI